MLKPELAVPLSTDETLELIIGATEWVLTDRKTVGGVHLPENGSYEVEQGVRYAPTGNLDGHSGALFGISQTYWEADGVLRYPGRGRPSFYPETNGQLWDTGGHAVKVHNYDDGHADPFHGTEPDHPSLDRVALFPGEKGTNIVDRDRLAARDPIVLERMARTIVYALVNTGNEDVVAGLMAECRQLSRW